MLRHLPRDTRTALQHLSAVDVLSTVNQEVTRRFANCVDLPDEARQIYRYISTLENSLNNALKGLVEIVARHDANIALLQRVMMLRITKLQPRHRNILYANSPAGSSALFDSTLYESIRSDMQSATALQTQELIAKAVSKPPYPFGGGGRWRRQEKETNSKSLATMR